MSSTHTAEFKAKVALEALSGNKDSVSEVAAKYDVSTAEVEAWVSELQGNATAAFGGSDQGQVLDVEIESDNAAFVHAVNYGVEDEGLNMPSIYMWSGIGIVAVVVFIAVLIPFAQYSLNNAKENANITSSYYEIEKLTQEADERLNSYGVVDLEEGVYRIPIDEAINTLAVD